MTTRADLLGVSTKLENLILALPQMREEVQLAAIQHEEVFSQLADLQNLAKVFAAEAKKGPTVSSGQMLTLCDRITGLLIPQ